MDVLTAIRGRRSIRAFTEKPVLEEEVETLVDAAQHAPSAGNIQPWEFIVVRKPETKRKLAKAALDQTFIEEAPVVIVVCANEDMSRSGYGSRGAALYCIQDTAAATQNIMLTAYALGLGTCWVGAFLEEQVKSALKIPKSIRPVAMIPVGHSDTQPSQRPRRPVNKIVHYEVF